MEVRLEDHLGHRNPLGDHQREDRGAQGAEGQTQNRPVEVLRWIRRML